MKNNKILIVIIVVLLILNVVSLSFIWKAGKHNDNRPPKVEQYLEKRLKLSNEQIQSFKIARKLHFKESSKLVSSITDLRLSLAKQDNSVQADSLVNRIASKNVELEKSNYEHFRKLREICNAEQKIKFDSLLVDLISKGNRYRVNRNTKNR